MKFPQAHGPAPDRVAIRAAASRAELPRAAPLGRQFQGIDVGVRAGRLGEDRLIAEERELGRTLRSHGSRLERLQSELGRERILPPPLTGEQFRRGRRKRPLEGGHLALQVRLPQFLLLGEERDQRTLVLEAAVLGVVEEREEFEQFFLGERIIFMVVTPGTSDRRAHPDGHGRVDLIDDRDVAELFVVGPAFVIRQRNPDGRR